MDQPNINRVAEFAEVSETRAENLHVMVAIHTEYV